MGKPVAVRDLDGLASWHADWRGLRVAVFGLGLTGFSVADTLNELGASVLVVCGSASDEATDLLDVLGVPWVAQPEQSAIPAALLAHDPELIVVSPGYRHDHPLVLWARAASIAMWGDVELAWRLRDNVPRAAEWFAVTGTNGKTTTVQLTTHLLVAAGQRAIAVGNIGIPVLDAIRDPIGFDALVVELSSFQLSWMPTAGPGAIAPIASVCLNIADDHLDWHGSRDAYIAAKGVVYANTRVACIYNRADDTTRSLVEGADVVEGCRAIGFGLDAPGPSDFGVVGDIVLDRAFLDDRHRSALELTTHGELTAAGLSAPHLVEDVLAAAALVRAAGVEAEVIRTALSTFVIDHHRTEPVLEQGGILWIDDSKATNPHAANAALGALTSVVWIVGGLLKGTDLGEVIDSRLSRLKAAVIIGRDRAPLVAAFARHAPRLPVFEVAASETSDVMPEAVRLAASVAVSGDVVLLAPAAASMDQFTDYADRGRRFSSAVRTLLGGREHDNNTPAGDPPTEPTVV